jgi:hypothetical protein
LFFVSRDLCFFVDKVLSKKENSFFGEYASLWLVSGKSLVEIGVGVKRVFRKCFEHLFALFIEAAGFLATHYDEY